MAANVNIYVAGTLVSGALANRRRRAANLMRVPCLNEEGDHLLHKQAKYCWKQTCLIFTRVKIEDIFPMENPNQYAV